MKRMLLIFGMCFLVLGLVAQEIGKLLEDQRVEPPKFKGEIVEKERVEVAKSPIASFLEEELVFPKTNYDTPPEGIVIVEFTVNADGNVSNFNVTNSVVDELDNAVIDCLKKTDGKWIPGKVNGQPSPMEKRVFVKFDVPGNPSFEVLAKNLYFYAIKKYNKGRNIKDDNLLSSVKKEKKSDRMFKQSLFYLTKATVYFPEESSLVYWQARNHEMLGDSEQMRQKLNKIAKLKESLSPEQQKENMYNLAVIVKKSSI